MEWVSCQSGLWAREEHGAWKARVFLDRGSYCWAVVRGTGQAPGDKHSGHVATEEDGMAKAKAVLVGMKLLPST